MISRTTLKHSLAAALISTASLFAASPSFADADLKQVPAGTYSVDPSHAYINFQYNHLGLSNPTLSFDDFTVDMNLDTENPAKTTVAVEIKADSLVTGSAIWTDHISGKKWFDFATYPTMKFTSTEVTGSGSSFKMTGDLTVKDVTKPVTLDVTINAAMNHPMNKKPVVGISAKGTLLRSDWGLGANAPYVSDEIKLSIEAEMFKK